MLISFKISHTLFFNLQNCIKKKICVDFLYKLEARTDLGKKYLQITILFFFQYPLGCLKIVLSLKRFPRLSEKDIWFAKLQKNYNPTKGRRLSETGS